MKNKVFNIYKLIFIISISVFLFMAVCLKLGYLDSFDDALRYGIYQTRTRYLTYLWRFITYCGERYTVIAIVLILLFNKNLRSRYGNKFAVSAILSTAIYLVMKQVFQRARPDIALRLIEQGGYSFPSGHAMNCLASYGILIYLILKNFENRKTAKLLSVLLCLLIILIGLSRVYLGVHYPSDIIAGWSLGIAVLVGLMFTFEKLDSK